MAQFTVDGVKCTASDAQLGSRQIACPGSAFSWHIDGSNSDYTLTLFKGVNRYVDALLLQTCPTLTFLEAMPLRLTARSLSLAAPVVLVPTTRSATRPARSPSTSKRFVRRVFMKSM